MVIGAIDCDAHQELAEQYEVKGFPTIKYFGSNGVEDYTGGRDLADFVKFLNEKSGLDFAPDGGLMPTAGIVEQISEHVKSYLVASTEEERSKIIGTCEQAVKTLDDKAQSNFKYYIKVFAKISAKGGSYIRSEKERLSKILHAGSSLKSSQKKSFIRRINVLNSFDEL